jgi:hypothetical protein
MGSGYEFGSLLSGSRQIYVGKSESHFMYQDIDSAIAAAEHGDVILVEPGTYTLTTKITLNKCVTIKGLGAKDAVKITSSATIGSELMAINVPASYGADCAVYLENLYFLGADTDQHVIAVNNNGGAAQVLKLFFDGCTVNLASAAATGHGVYVGHTTTTKGIKVYFSGCGRETIQCVYFLVKSTADVLEFHNVRLLKSDTLKAVKTSADDVAVAFLFKDTIVPHENGTEGGHASQLIASIGSFSYTSGAAYGLLDTNDLTGSHTETTLLPVS